MQKPEAGQFASVLLTPTSHTKIEPIHGVIVFLQFILRNNQEKTVPSYIFSGATTPIKFRAF